ncbi:phosphate ABC transporter permease subunit PstC [Oscillatoria sp. CS-180]|uniref:phosphate ABC transporter permease subunit PstC n=1 Tax=Oscillatoria sp. CS-180 TaxID=3021720 RepID=UPI00232BA46F|nr:phosphate ABC transporter permease subunit PstC [Oscillatoria sp. CS-180]MDB9529157.1 phosphate ABC transporter permease subunit PstC [Oscillatoria sp. CS-180]
MSADMPSSRSPSLWQANYQQSKTLEKIIRGICGLFAVISIATTAGIIGTLIFETFEFFQEVPLWNFLTDTRWTPLFASKQFGIFVLMSATLLTSTIAITVAVPLGLLSAIFLSEYASSTVRNVLKPLLEILAGIPSVVFGYFALLTVTPFLQKVFDFIRTPVEIPAWLNFLPFTNYYEPDYFLEIPFPYLEGFNALSAGLVLGISITPLVASLSEDAIYSVPQGLRDGAYAMGATKRETITAVVIPAALSGIVASIILAISRAVGETMIVTLAAGQNPNLGFNPFVPVMTMTAYIVQVSLGDTAVGTLPYKTIFAVGMTLFLLTLTLNIFSFWFVRRFRERYE